MVSARCRWIGVLAGSALAVAAHAGGALRAIDEGGERVLAEAPQGDSARIHAVSMPTEEAVLDTSALDDGVTRVLPTAPMAQAGIVGAGTYPRRVASVGIYGERGHGSRPLVPFGSLSSARSGGWVDTWQRGSSLWPVVRAVGLQMGVDPTLVMGVIDAESGFNDQARSDKGALGLMQLMPGTAARFGVAQRQDALENLWGGVSYLSYLLQRFHGNVTYALAGYNAGENAVDRYGGVPPYDETRMYVARVLAAQGRWAAWTGGNAVVRE